MDKKILICSNNSYFSRTVEKDLLKQEYQVQSTRAKNGELLNIMTKVLPDLTILDAPLVYIDGMRELIDIRDTLNTHLMMLSTQGSKADTVRTLSMGPSNHPHLKPVTFEELVKQVNNLLLKK